MSFFDRGHVIRRAALCICLMLAARFALAVDEASPTTDAVSTTSRNSGLAGLAQPVFEAPPVRAAHDPSAREAAATERPSNTKSPSVVDAATLRNLYASADQGNSSAMASLGTLFHLGMGVPQDDVEALDWYRRAADLGQPDAMNNIGTLYLTGHGTQQDYAEAMKWYQRAADAGSLLAMGNIAELYAHGLGVERSYTEASRWFQLASTQGSPSAMNSLGLMYDTGIGVAQDHHVAAALIKRSAALGYGPAMANLGSMYERGDGVEADTVEAYAWLDAALMAGLPAQARDVIVYRMGAMSARLKREDLALAMKRAAEIFDAARAARQPLPAIGAQGAATQLFR
jgi:TPR repeat protein